jgi:hypothetical protein
LIPDLQDTKKEAKDEGVKVVVVVAAVVAAITFDEVELIGNEIGGELHLVDTTQPKSDP